MAKEKGAAPSRRLPGRSGRASFEGDQVAAEGAGVRQATSNDDDDDGSVVAPSAYATSQAQQSDAGSGSASAAAPPAATPAKKGRGRPRKKPLEPPPLSAKEEQVDPEVAAIVGRASPSSSPRTVGGWESGPVVPGRHAVTMPKRDAGNKAGATTAVKDDNAAAAAAEGNGADGNDGNESDEWSDHDEVHYLPPEVKAQFGQVGKQNTERERERERQPVLNLCVSVSKRKYRKPRTETLQI